MKKLVSLVIVAIALAFALPAGAAPEKLKLSNPMNAPKVAAVDTAKAGPTDKKEIKKAKKAKKVVAKAKSSKEKALGADKKKPS